MFTQFLQRFFSSSQITNNIEELQLKQIREEELSTSASISKPLTRKETTTSPNPYEQDFKALEEHFGVFHDGMEIEIDLRTLLSICPRERRKSDAFKGLRSQLRRNGVTLSIVNTPKNNK